MDAIFPHARSNEPAPKIRARLIDRDGNEPLRISNRLSAREQDRLRSIAKLMVFPKAGTTIFSRGDDAEFVYVVDQGIVRITRTALSGQRRILAFMAPGDLFGIPDCGVYANTAETVGPAKLHRFSWPKLRQLMTEEPLLQHTLLIKLAHDFRQAQRQMMMLGQQSAHQRLAMFLLDFIRNPDFYDKALARLTIPVNRFDLADYLGTTRETAARAMTRLEEKGLVKRINAQTVEILNMKGLQQLQHGRARSGAGAR
jgi:CRP-like cAMP-binding protein